MSDKEIQRYFDFYTQCWKLLHKGLQKITTASDPVKYANELRDEGQHIYEEYQDLNHISVLNIITNTLRMIYDVYEKHPRPEREPEQMNIFDLGKEAKG